uniref:Uncharacterized protein n=1 Tax=Lepeophtheirus salmonis TaxID=72036 RepID=A0A0K2TXU2_LEPSM
MHMPAIFQYYDYIIISYIKYIYTIYIRDNYIKCNLNTHAYNSS